MYYCVFAVLSIFGFPDWALAFQPVMTPDFSALDQRVFFLVCVGNEHFLIKRNFLLDTVQLWRAAKVLDGLDILGAQREQREETMTAETECIGPNL
ncbi:hypothetical protein NEOLEDRAFT_784718 [Neolentinus lepideus HHB14362 ss-1]|uniref:Secreted protein n=1 Tax=Neolentinus lepideus HHB14362 ss-1 TaxID=1314782 RepID=A0A165UXY1_9AGAM|nr:hypothetical protein NEOLEDRAFT_784718 [Neolentinus lepideus HHB14362 ss-1]